MPREIIGNVVINLDDYPGEDLYSDGAVEDELLEIARTYPPEAYDEVIAKRKDWAVMYHFSPLRENILTWYPFSKTDRVLEIGSGCGAVTGALSRAAGSVTCIELSRRRSLINANRHRECGNIEIRLGNFETVEEKLPCDYDAVTLIGVFEYGRGYISGNKPYHTFLQKAMRHLKEGGVLLLAIENRLGLKYFAGCREDHTGVYFEGIEGYRRETSVRTFSKPELIRILEECGCTDYAFYYPYPDYKFPMAVYSDRYLPRPGDLRQNLENFDRSRMLLFDESRAFDSLLRDGLFPLFSNSFLLAVRKRGGEMCSASAGEGGAEQ